MWIGFPVTRWRFFGARPTLSPPPIINRACDQFKDMWVYRTEWKLPAKFTCDHCMLQVNNSSAPAAVTKRRGAVRRTRACYEGRRGIPPSQAPITISPQRALHTQSTPSPTFFTVLLHDGLPLLAAVPGGEQGLHRECVVGWHDAGMIHPDFQMESMMLGYANNQMETPPLFDLPSSFVCASTPSRPHGVRHLRGGEDELPRDVLQLRGACVLVCWVCVDRRTDFNLTDRPTLTPSPPSVFVHTGHQDPPGEEEAEGLNCPEPESICPRTVVAI